MNLLQNWAATPLAQALGWALVHFVWQGALAALTLAVVFHLLRPASARLRYGAACVVLFAMPLAFGVTAALSLTKKSTGAPPPYAYRQLVLAPLPPLGDGVPAEPGAGALQKSLPYLAPVWMAGVLLFGARSLAGWMAAQRLRRTGVCVAPPGWQDRLDSLAARLRLSRPVVLMESCLAQVPMVIGFFRPVVLMPLGVLTGFQTAQLESILIHELAHIRRYDYLVNLAQSCVEGLLFYHPAVWWISAQVRAERENCCDDVVVALAGDARGYAAVLVALEQNRWPAGEPALAATGGKLMKRVRRLLEAPEGPRAAVAPVFTAGLLLVLAAIALSAWQPRPAAAPQPVSVAEPQAAAEPQSDPTPQSVPAAPANPSHQERRAALLKEEQATGGSPYRNWLNEDVAYIITDEERAAFQRLQTDEERTHFIQQMHQRSAELRSVLDTPYRNWLNEDVAYIITDEERAAFQRVQADEEREHFIEQFWLRRDPTPGTVENEFKEEHYRRIAYANEHYASGIPGWKTDRGRIYITFGPPDEIEDYHKGSEYQSTTAAFPFQRWHYRYIEGVGTNVIIEFVDPTGAGEYHMTMDPSEKSALLLVGPPSSPGPPISVDVSVRGVATITVPLDGVDWPLHIRAQVVNATGRTVAYLEDQVRGQREYKATFTLLPGSYRLTVIGKPIGTNASKQSEVTFAVN